ncbi:lipopolysaccharide biosynthesis protein [Noviluteimonas dokdonensis]|uniref:lipopolysaccharide biosynthesis protein n=1 Tax=Noviluteimonas dokdonensis TaxID=414050 RepID=UPI0005674E94|nr:oligosaccharide flippase family protein [Lysobacter dokdonensis]
MPLLQSLIRARKSLPRQFALQVATLLFGRVTGAAMQALSLMVFARCAGVSEFGVLATALGVAVVLQTAGDVGATTFIAREIADKGLSPEAKGAEQLSRFGTLSAAFVGALVLAALALVSEPIYLQLLPLAVWLPVERAIELRASASLANGDAKIGVACVATRRSLSLLLFIALVWLHLQPVLAYSLSALTAAAMTLAFFNNRLCLIGRGPGISTGFREAFRSCRPYWLHSLFVQSRNLDAPLVTLILGPHNAAFFSLAARLMTPLRMVPAAISSALLPYLTRAKLSQESEQTLLLIVSAGMAVPYLLLAWLAPMAIHLVLGARYADAAVPTQIMIAALAFVSSASIVTAAIQAKGSATTAARLTVMCTPVYVALVAIGATTSGSVGAAVGAASAMCFQMFGLVVAYRLPRRAGSRATA